MLKKVIIIILILLGLILLAFWSPWQHWNLSPVNLLGIESKELVSSLKVKSLAGDIEVSLDGKDEGTATAAGDFLDVTPVDPGEHTLLLKRKASGNVVYAEIARKVNFEPGVDVVVGYEIGPTEEFSEGHILYARKSYVSDNNPFLEVYSSPDQVGVTLDGKYLGDTPLKSIPLDISSKHKVSFSKQGYDPLEIDLLPDSQQDRDKLKNLTLTLEVNLFARPVNVVTQ